MSVEITIRIPESLEARLRDLRDQLPRVIELGLNQIAEKRAGIFQDEDAIMRVLTSNPTPDQVLAIQPLHELQARVSDLLARSKAGGLGHDDEIELEHHLTLEHLVRLAKAHAYQRLATAV